LSLYRRKNACLGNRTYVTVELMVRVVVCRLSVRLSSVTDVLWLSVRSKGKTFYTNNALKLGVQNLAM